MKKFLKHLVNITLFAIMLLGVLDSKVVLAQENTDYTDKITIVWYPNDSGAELANAREAIGAYVEKATGKKVEHQLTTDYVIAIEALANNQANMALIGSTGFVEANKQNSAIQPLVVESGASGTLEDAVYYSWFNVIKGNEDQYVDQDGNYSLDNIKGKRMSFVSNTSTSGFTVPTNTIINYFEDEDLTQEDLMEGEEDKFFSKVLYGGSHQGSLLNILTDAADVAAFSDINISNYVELVEGSNTEVGSIWKVKEDAGDPFTNFTNEEFVLISVTPVLNDPIVINTENTSKEDVEALKEIFTSVELNNDPEIWVPEDSDVNSLFEKDGNSQFVIVEDSWFDPIREMMD